MKSKLKVLPAVLIALIFLIAPFIVKPTTASAGASMANVASVASVVGGRINTGDFMVSGGVTAKDTAIIFNEECSSSSKIVGKTKINNLKKYGVSTLLEAGLKLRVENIVEDGVFSLCFGLSSLSSKRASVGVTELRFYYDNGVTFTALEHVAEGISNVIVSQRQPSYLQNGGEVFVKVSVTTDGKFTLRLNGAIVADTLTYEGCDGYFAIFSEGKNVVSVDELAIYGYSYDLPENVEYTETFSNGEYNSNIFYTMSKTSPVSPSYLTVENDALVFSNTAGAHITTRQNYSNFELSFDILDLQRTAEIDEKGNIVKLISNWFSIAFGVDSYSQLPESTYQLATALQLEGMPSDENTDQTQPNSNPRFVLWDKFSAQSVSAMNPNIWDASYDGKIINLKFTLIDGQVNLWLKTEDETWGEPCFSYDLGFTPYGCVRIFTWGQNSVVGKGVTYNSVANFTIDNLSIKNADYEEVKKVVEVGFKSNLILDTPDYNYGTVTDDNDLLQNRIDSIVFDDGKGLIWIILGIVGGVVVAGGAVAFIIIKKRGANRE